MTAVITDRPAYMLDLLDAIASPAWPSAWPRKSQTAPRASRGRGRPAPALPVRLRQALQGVPRRPGRRRTVFVGRPFEGLPSECDVVALRELVPAATAPLPLTRRARRPRRHSSCTLLPMAAPAMVRESGEVWLALQVQHTLRRPGPRPRRRADGGARAGRARRRRAHRRARARGRGCRTWSPTGRSTSPSTTASTSGSPTSPTPPDLDGRPRAGQRHGATRPTG